jgi:hypothetical protein
MKTVYSVFVLVFLSLLMAGCSSEGQADDAVLFETLSAGDLGGITNQRSEVINNNAELNPFWSDLMNGFESPEAVPAVDFDSDFVIAVVAPEGAYGLTITRIDRKDRGMVVHATVDSCKSACVPVVLRPYQVVRVARMDFVLVDFVFSEEFI